MGSGCSSQARGGAADKGDVAGLEAVPGGVVMNRRFSEDVPVRRVSRQVLESARGPSGVGFARSATLDSDELMSCRPRSGPRIVRANTLASVRSAGASQRGENESGRARTRVSAPAVLAVPW